MILVMEADSLPRSGGSRSPDSLPLRLAAERASLVGRCNAMNSRQRRRIRAAESATPEWQ